jgi:uncharacterized membrane protein
MQDVAYLRRAAFLGALGAIGLSLWSAHQLLQLEHHQMDSVRVHWLIALLYENLGFWPAVLVFPALGVLAVVSIARKIARLRSDL